MLTIITINRNNAAGLEKTMKSVASQTCSDFEYVVIDGASTDGSVPVIRQFEPLFQDRMRWVSEPDTGIYNAMNKGIRMAAGDYVQFMNSGDCLAGADVITRMYEALREKGFPSILYGNMLKEMPDGEVRRDRGFAGREITLKGFIRGSLNHSPAHIRKGLFSQYGYYDERLKIVSDWKWYLQAIVLGKEKPAYTDLDVTLFDMTGISETNGSLREEERRKELEALIPSGILTDYDRWHEDMERAERLKRYPWAYKLTCFLERCLFKWEKKKLRETIKR